MYVSSYDIAMVYVAFCDKDQAFEWLEKAYEERSAWLVWLQLLPWCETVRSDPRFQELERRMGLPEREADSATPLERPSSQIPR